MSPALLAARQQLHDGLGAPLAGAGGQEVYLCHTFCELGAVRMHQELRVVRTVLDRHPREVLQFVIQNYVAPERLRAELDAAGLVEETPCTFVSATQLRGAGSCTDNRGTTASPMLQLNHWVTPPVQAHAAVRVATRVNRDRP